MPDFSKISQYVSGYDQYLNHTRASKCIKQMYKKEKNGKILVQFFKKAVERNEWYTDKAFRKLLDRAVEQSGKLSGKQKAKFEKVKQVFIAKTKTTEAKAQPKPAQPKPAQPKPVKPKTVKPKDKIELHLTAEQLAKKYTFGAKSREVACSMDWSKDDPILFDPTYVNTLISQPGRYSDGFNPCMSRSAQDSFIGFLSDLMGGAKIKDHYGILLSKENTDRIRQMMLAIMNKVNAKKGEPKFNEFYASIVNSVSLAINNCSNRMNTEIEAIFTGLNYPKEGSLGQRIRLALQEFRNQIFQKCIHTVVSQDPHYLRHEAASFNYYYGSIAERFGLPPSVSSLDHKFEYCAMKGQQENIKKIFNKEYAPLTIITKISKIIADPYDSSIPTKLFTDWIEARYTLEERYQLLDDTGNYRPECIVKLLKELEIFKSV